MGNAYLEESDKKIDWDNLKIEEKIVSLVPLESIERYRFFPFAEEEAEKILWVAVVDPTDINVQSVLIFLAKKNERKIKYVALEGDVFDNVLKRIKSPKKEISKALEDFETEAKEDDKKAFHGQRKRAVVEVIQDAPVAKMVDVIIKNAIDGKASDIHIEPLEDKVRVRYRVDGVLYNSIFVPKKVGPAIVSRIKILSNLKIDEKRKPQDGRFRIEDLGKTIDFRVSTFPVSTGEKIVLRILDKTEGLIDLEGLGIKGRDLQVLRKVIEEPYGIILVTGPTGSGKSTTLYSILNILNKEGVNIVTLEDPVEYVLEGIGQSQVKPEIGYTFASGLRSILRQDPDIVMVGEIRDEETAELAIHAALTGHLVLSTLHTNTAVGAIPRLMDMGIQPFLLASALKLIIGQRLVRRICPKCKKEKTEIMKDVEQIIKNELGGLPESRKGEFAKIISGEQPIKLFEGVGCGYCQNKGMKGRVGVYEVAEINSALVKLIGDHAPMEEIGLALQSSGYTTMKQDGIIKTISGETTLEEVQEATEEE